MLSTTSKCLEKQEKIIQKHLIRNTPFSNVKFIYSMQPSSWSHLMNHLILFSELTFGTEPGEMLADILPACTFITSSSLLSSLSICCSVPQTVLSPTGLNPAMLIYRVCVLPVSVLIRSATLRWPRRALSRL